MQRRNQHTVPKGSLSLLAAGATALIASMLGAGTAHAAGATLSANPSAVAPGAALTVSGNGWGPGTVSLTFLLGNTVLQAGAADAGPNGGPISRKVTAPALPGAWQVCADGLQQSDGAPVVVCANFTVNPPATTPPTTVANTLPPATTAVASTTTSSTTTSSTIPSSSTSTPPLTAPPSSVLPTAPPTTAPVRLPSSPDGFAVWEEPNETADGSGLSGLTIGLLAGIGVLTAAGVVGMLSSGIGARPRPAGAIGAVVVGGLLAGGVGLAMPPPKVNIPKLAVTRVQTSATIARNSSQTVTANCPPGQVVLGGGWSSDWDSTRIDDPQPMVRWMEADPVYVIARAQVRRDGGGLPNIAYWYIARADESAHLSDQAWESNRFPWYYQYLVDRARNPDYDDPFPEPFNIPYRPDVAQAFAADYYRSIDQDTGRFVGTLVEKSGPVEQGWSVTAALGKASLQTQINLQVVATCAPLATSIDQPGVLGVTFRSTSVEGGSNAPCKADERVTSIGFTSERMRGLVEALPSTYLNAAKFTSLNGTATITAVCVRAQGFATTSATGSTTVTGGWDGSTSATCPANFTAVGGGASFAAKDLKGNGVSVPQAVSGLMPIDNKTFGVEIRGTAWEPPQNPSGRGLIDIPAGNYAVPLVYYATHDTTGVTVTAICAQRVLG